MRPASLVSCLSFSAWVAFTAHSAVVRELDSSAVPSLADKLSMVGNFAEQWYPRIVKALVLDGSYQAPASVDFAISTNLDVPALTTGSRITLSKEWFAKMEQDLGAVIHELAHVVQSYPPGRPGHWVEGVADCVRYQLGFSNAWSHPRCCDEFPHYTSGYWCSAAFLLYVQRASDENFLKKLNSALHSPDYSDSFFREATGKTVEALWMDYQASSEFGDKARRALGRFESRTAQNKEECLNHLREVHKAIMAYRKDNGVFPNWLSDLVPNYIGDTNLLMCPITRETGRFVDFGLNDPLMPQAYTYEFCAAKVPSNVMGGSAVTMREFKLQQKEMVGSSIPIARCHLHEPVLNVAYNGKTYESPTAWEFIFTNAVNTLGDLFPKPAAK